MEEKENDSLVEGPGTPEAMEKDLSNQIDNCKAQETVSGSEISVTSHDEKPLLKMKGHMAVCNLACECLTSSATPTADLAQRKLYIRGNLLVLLWHMFGLFMLVTTFCTVGVGVDIQSSHVLCQDSSPAHQRRPPVLRRSVLYYAQTQKSAPGPAAPVGYSHPQSMSAYTNSTYSSPPAAAPPSSAQPQYPSPYPQYHVKKDPQTTPAPFGGYPSYYMTKQ